MESSEPALWSGSNEQFWYIVNRRPLKIGCLPLCMLMIVTVVSYCHLGSGCYLLTETRIESSNTKWTAISAVHECPSPLSTFIPAGVEIVSNANLRHRAEILYVDTGSDDQRPRIAWTAPNVLQVTVPSKSDLTVLQHSYQGI